MIQDHVQDAVRALAAMSPEQNAFNDAYHELHKLTRVTCELVGIDYDEALRQAREDERVAEALGCDVQEVR